LSTLIYKSGTVRPWTAALTVVAFTASIPLTFGGQATDQSLAPATDPGASAAPAGPTLVRVTSSFEVIHAGAVLKQVAKLFSAGFVRKDAEEVAKLIDALSAEQSRSWEFNGVRKGVTYTLRIRARIDEFGMLDLDFFAAPELAAPVRAAVDGYLNARGL
jgi:hypothetical protein